MSGPTGVEGSATGPAESSPFDDRHGHSIEQFRGDMRVLFRVIRDKRTPIYVPLLMLGVVIYAMSPVDAVPDIIPFAGILDETMVFLICREFVFRVVPEEHIEEHAIDVAMTSSSSFGVGRAFAFALVIQIGLIITLVLVLGGTLLTYL